MNLFCNLIYVYKKNNYVRGLEAVRGSFHD